MHERNETTTRRWANAALAVAFAAGIALPCVGTLLRLDTGGIPGENRAMAPPPTLDGKLRELPKRVESWFNDYFGMRNSLVRAHSLVELKAFGVSASSDVVVGKDGWLFFAADRIIECRRGVLPFSEDDLRRWQTALEERRDWLSSKGIRYVFMIAPEKSSLYAEMLPDALRPVRNETRLDQLVAWMRARSTVEVIDVRPSLRCAKDEGRIWNLTDTHWNDAGAFAAYRLIAERLWCIFNLQPLEIDEFDRQVHVTPGGDLAGMLALTNCMREERIVLVPKTPSPVRAAAPTDVMNKRAWLPGTAPAVFTCEGAGPLRAVILHDSFFLQLRPYLSRNFARSTFVWWIFPPDVIADEKPDVVIEEMVERLLSRPGFFPANEPPVAGFKRAP